MTTSVQSSTSSTAAAAATAAASPVGGNDPGPVPDAAGDAVAESGSAQSDGQFASHVADGATLHGERHQPVECDGAGAECKHDDIAIPAGDFHDRRMPRWFRADQIDLASGQSNGAVELTQPADKVTVTISDAKGNVVRTLQLGYAKRSRDRQLPMGWNRQYRRDSGGWQLIHSAPRRCLGTSNSSPTTLSYGMVNNVALTSSGPTLGMGTLGNVALSSVRQIL